MLPSCPVPSSPHWFELWPTVYDMPAPCCSVVTVYTHAWELRALNHLYVLVVLPPSLGLFLRHFLARSKQRSAHFPSEFQNQQRVIKKIAVVCYGSHYRWEKGHLSDSRSFLSYECKTLCISSVALLCSQQRCKVSSYRSCTCIVSSYFIFALFLL